MSKLTKNAQLKQITSLDEKHDEMLEKFYNNEHKQIPKLKEEIKKLKEELKQYSNEQIDKILDIQDKISEKKDIIKQMQKEKKKYLLDNSRFIFDYFESKKQISSGEQAQNVKVLNSFFKVKSTMMKEVILINTISPRECIKNTGKM
jgi:DNA-directed RNA polymerase subunit F